MPHTSVRNCWGTHPASTQGSTMVPCIDAEPVEAADCQPDSSATMPSRHNRCPDKMAGCNYKGNISYLI